MQDLCVIEFGCYLAAPLACRHLCDLGATVVCVRRPPTARGANVERRWGTTQLRRGLNAGKRVVDLNLQREEDLREAERLIAGADVVVENFAPGVMERLGLGYRDCQRLRPDIVYVSMPAFSSSRRGGKGWESAIMATCGVYRDMGFNRRLRGATASYTHLPLASVYASVFAAYAAVGALHRGGGDHIEVALADALGDVLQHNSVEVERLPEGYRCRRDIALERGVTVAGYRDTVALTDPFFSHYLCADGRPLYLVAPCHLTHQRRLLEATGLLEEAQRLLTPADSYGGRPLGLGGNRLDDDEADTLRGRLEETFATRPSREWVEVLRRWGVPVARHQSAPEWAVEAAASGSLRRVGGSSLSPGPVAWLEEGGEEEGGEATTRPPPRRRERLWFSGVRVLDLTNVIAGPTCGHMLARFGADVIKVDPPRPTYSTGVTLGYGLLANRGKRSVLLDLKTEEGRGAFEALLGGAHLVLINTTRQGLERLGLTPEELRRVNPEVSLCHFDAWGNLAGTGCDAIAYDDNVQAATGIMERFGGGLDTVEEHAHIGMLDVIAGVAAALASAAALLRHRRRGGGGGCVARSSLAALGQAVQYPFLCGSLRQIEAMRGANPGGIDCLGTGPLHHIYPTRGGDPLMLLLSLDASSSSDRVHWREAATPCNGGHLEEVLAGLERVMGVRLSDDRRGDTLAMARRFAERSAEEWQEAFRGEPSLEGGLLPLPRLADTKREGGVFSGAFSSAMVVEDGLGRVEAFRTTRSIRVARPGACLELTSAPSYGSDADTVLEGLPLDPSILGRLEEISTRGWWWRNR